MTETTNLFPGVRVVLVGTSHPGNIGAAARAMKNMGLTELVLVNPLDFPNMKAIFRSASAEDVVRDARVVETVEEALADCALVIGTYSSIYVASNMLVVMGISQEDLAVPEKEGADDPDMLGS